CTVHDKGISMQTGLQGNEHCPHALAALRLHRGRGGVPTIEVTNERHTSRLRCDQHELDRTRRDRVRELLTCSASQGRLLGRQATVPVKCETCNYADANQTGRQRRGCERRKDETPWLDQPGEHARSAP